ncbi:ROK family protein [Granulicoccus sp. GXG6511]|uniref:ROK family protein n=1 Tax=Granulicoccus sp. GXG6511 TaxID=3381351 RepID=UPI003D7CF06A
MTPVGALEIGGSHVSVAMVDGGGGVGGYARFPLDSTGSLTSFLATVAAAVAAVGDVPSATRWSVAIPGPFDYAHGVGGVHPAGKLAGLAGVDVRAALAPVLGTEAIEFVNDATAFALGAFELHAIGSKLLALTFGSGIGSAFIEDGAVVLDDRVPPAGEVYRLPAGGGTIESRFGPAALAGARGFDSFRALAEHARTDPTTAAWTRAEFQALADALAPWLRTFRPDTVVCGGGVCHAWDLFGDAFTQRLAGHTEERLRVAHVVDTEQIALLGAARVAAQSVE